MRFAVTWKQYSANANEPAHRDYEEKRSLSVFQATVSSDCHEDV